MKLTWLPAVCCIAILAAQTHSAAIPTEDTFIVAKSEGGTEKNDLTTEEPDAPIKLTEMRVKSEVSLRYAHTAVITRVRNPARRAQQTTFHVLLPETAFISGFIMTLNGKSYQAYVKEKEKAKKLYSTAVSQGVSAAHISTKARDSNHFTVSVNVEPKTEAVFNLTYEELLVRRNGTYKHAINLHPGVLVPNMEVSVHIKELQKISVLRIPEIRTGNEIDTGEDDTKNTKAVLQKSNDGKEATITFTPDLEEQTRLAKIYKDKTRKSASSSSSYHWYSSQNDNESSISILGQFVVLYDVERPEKGEILVNDGYFVHFFAPPALKPLSKHVVFVLDTSGSMEGRKIEQLKQAMRAILNDLHPNDYFSIVEFNSDVKVYKLSEALEQANLLDMWGTGELQGDLNPPEIASVDNIAKAQTIVSRLKAAGGTSIYKALDVAVDLINKKFETNQGISTTAANDTEINNELQPIIIFLTDGSANMGESDPTRIVSYISEKNSGTKKAAIYSLALGQGADRELLRKLSLRNEGFMRHIYEAADAALQLKNFYRQISSPLLSHVNFLYPPEQVKEGSVTQHKFKTVFLGSEVVIAGELAAGAIELAPQLQAFCVDENSNGVKRYEVKNKVDVEEKKEHLPLERMWAYLTIKQLLDKRDANKDTEQKYENSALAIALKYGFVTPLTSLVVVKPNTTDAVEVESVDRTTTQKSISRAFHSYSSSKRRNSMTTMNSFDYRQNYSSRYSILGLSHGVPHYYRVMGGALSSGSDDYNDMSENIGDYEDSGDRILGGYRHYSVPTRKYTTQAPSTSTQYTTPAPSSSTTDSFENIYHLKDYTWALSLLNGNTSSLEFTANGKNITLELSKSTLPPKDITDSECAHSVRASNDMREAGVCVYLTRCAAARSIAPDLYRDTYCVVQNKYAGICCPTNRVNIKAA